MTISTGIKEEVMVSLLQFAKKNNLSKIILFGSRARGDFHRTSDIDLAVQGGNITNFWIDVNEDTPTLLKFDIVNLDGTVQTELRESIEKEGITLYEKV